MKIDLKWGRADGYLIGLLLAVYASVFGVILFCPARVNHIAFQLQFSYVSQWMIGTDGWPSGLWASIVPSTTVGNPTYPPGIYYLIWVVQKLFGGSLIPVHIALFIIQAAVPVLIYVWARMFVGRGFAFTLATFVSAVSFDSWTSPDIAAQPLLILSCFFITHYLRKERVRDLTITGMLLGIVIFFKYNVGLTALAAFTTVVIVSSLVAAPAAASPRPTLRRAGELAVLGGYLVFFIVTAKLFTHLEDYLFYLVPFSAAFAFLFYLYLRKEMVFDEMKLLKRVVILWIFPVVVVVLWLGIFGSVMGLGRYFSVLVGMDFVPDVKGSLDRGIFGMAAMYFAGTDFSTLQKILESGLRSSLALLLLVPILVNVYMVWVMWRAWREKGIAELLKGLPFFVLPLMAVFTYYPLESNVILTNRLFFFAGALAFAVFHRGRKDQFVAALAVLLVFFAGVQYSRMAKYSLSTIKDFRHYRVPQIEGVGLPLREDKAAELERNVAYLKGAVGDNPYLILASYGTAAGYLYKLTGLQHPAYYSDFRPKYVDKAVYDEITAHSVSYPYLVVQKQDFDDPKEIARESQRYADLLLWVASHYERVGEYVRDGKVDEQEMIDFYVYRLKGGA